MAKLPIIIASAVLLSVTLFSLNNSFADTGCRRDCEPPTLGFLYTGQQVVEKGFTINGKSFDVSELTQTIPTTAVRTGDTVTISLIVYENSGAGYLRNTALSLGKYADDNHRNEIATISFKQPFSASPGHPLTSGSDVSQVTVVTDPDGYLKDVKVKAHEVDSYRTQVDMSFKVTKQMDVSDVIIETMDAKLGSRDNVLFNALKVTGKDIVSKAPPMIKPVPPTPLKQLKSKLTAQQVECRDGYEKITRNSGAIACVSSYTADLLKSKGLAS